MMKKEFGEGKKLRKKTSREGVGMVFWNIAGLKGKDAEFWKYLGAFDVIGLTETWVEEKDWNKVKKRLPKGWNWKCQEAVRDCKRERAKGRIVTGVRKELEGGELWEKEGVVVRKIVIEGDEWKIGTIYNRGGVREGLEKVGEMIKEEEENMMIIGDFNARIEKMGSIEDWNERKGRNSKDERVNREGQWLMEMVADRGWMVINGNMERNREGNWIYYKGEQKSVIDYGITNATTWGEIREMSIGREIDLDHMPVQIWLNGKSIEKGKGEDKLREV